MTISPLRTSVAAALASRVTTFFVLCESSKAAFLLSVMSGGEYFVEHPTLREFIAIATEIVRGVHDVTSKLSQLREPYKALLSDPDWLPTEFQQPSGNTTMGDGIASLLLYRSELKDLSVRSA
jgi:hypothetical protein